jgi:hypothetical protein
VVRFLRVLKRLGIAAVVALACAGTAEAGNDTSLAQARRDVDASDYLAARSDLVAALNSGTADPDQLAEIYRLSGIVEAALGDTAAATTAFSKWLALDPRAELPAGTSPKITRPFDAAAKKKPGKLELKPETSAEPPHLAIVVESDPLKLVARARVYVSVDGQPEKKLEATNNGKGKLELDLPRGKRLDVRVEALDEHGNTVALVGSRDVPIVITGSDQASGLKPQASGTEKTENPETPPKDTGTKIEVHVDATPNERPIALKWWLWGGVAVVMAGGATYFGLQARSEADELRKLNADSQNHQFSEAQAVQSRADRDAMLFNIGMIGAGVIAVGAGILYLTEPRAETHMAAVPTQGGAAVVLGGSF